ncbi:unnamed protein product [Toxocara canis]|uniref:Very low-density lipoprotein receptor n=1 Tax=Toxocara canis TaxID=6265 RepID=A0A183V207_TOXCA|nr:unnamed protein product [Toxocara canis]
MIAAARVLLWASLFVSTTQAQCPANTFTCKDGSCIPQDWVGDGEPDCDDSSDEAAGVVMHLSASGSFSNDTLLKPSRRRQMEEAADDPFDSNATRMPTSATSAHEVMPPLRPNGAATTSQICASDVQHRIDLCSADLISWAQSIGGIDFTKISLLSDKESWSQVNQACDLITEYRTCTEGLQVSNCVIPETIRMWSDADLYACQLLLPSIREHEKCFSTARDSPCSTVYVCLILGLCEGIWVNVKAYTAVPFFAPRFFRRSLSPPSSPILHHPLLQSHYSSMKFPQSNTASRIHFFAPSKRFSFLFAFNMASGILLRQTREVSLVHLLTSVERKEQ